MGSAMGQGLKRGRVSRFDASVVDMEVAARGCVEALGALLLDGMRGGGVRGDDDALTLTDVVECWREHWGWYFV